VTKETVRYGLNIEDIVTAGKIIANGGLVAFPTETVYGLGADATNEYAVKSIYAAKGRPSDNPMIVHIAEMEELEDIVKGGYDGIPDVALDIMSAFWPGPLTIILPKSDKIPDVTTGGLDTVAVRMPANETALQLIASAGVPIAAPSANLSGKPSPTNGADVLEDMDGRIDAIIMGEACNVGIESTVLDVTGKTPIILRPGIITAEMIKNTCKVDVKYDASLKRDAVSSGKQAQADPALGVADTDFKPKSPGMKYKHYAPKAKVMIIEGDEADFRKKSLVLGKAAKDKGLKAAVLNYDDDVRKAARKLFADLRELDREGYDLILIRALDETGLGFSVMNRMLKSAGYEVV